MNLNENIRNFRNFRRIKQQELADKLGKSKSVISNWERGENSPDLESIEKMCKIFKVTPNELFGWEVNPEYKRYIQDLEKYQSEIESLRKEALFIEKRIEELELLKLQTIQPDLDEE